MGWLTAHTHMYSLTNVIDKSRYAHNFGKIENNRFEYAYLRTTHREKCVWSYRET